MLYGTYKLEVPTSLPYDLIRLRQEKDILSKGLADCVTYLKVLREKQSDSEHRLRTETGLRKKKRKRLQQTMRYIDSEIKNRERDEQAFLNNLQACETNIFVANMEAYRLTNASFQAVESTSTPTLYAPTLCSNFGSETTDLTWDVWTDEASIAPSQKNSIILLLADACTEVHMCSSATAKETKRPAPLCQMSPELSNSIPVPPNTAQLQFKWPSVLDPGAAAFQPTYSSADQQPQCLESNLTQLYMSSAIDTGITKALNTRRFSSTEIVPALQRFYMGSGLRLPGQMWYNTTPQLGPQRIAEVLVGRHRASSL